MVLKWTELYNAAKAVQYDREISDKVWAGGVAAAIESYYDKFWELMKTNKMKNRTWQKLMLFSIFKMKAGSLVLM